jgi:hypothetical protein
MALLLIFSPKDRRIPKEGESQVGAPDDIYQMSAINYRTADIITEEAIQSFTNTKKPVQKSINNFTVIESADGGFCDTRFAEVIGKTHNYIFSSLGCYHDEKTDFTSFEKVISTFKFTDVVAKSNQGVKSSAELMNELIIKSNSDNYPLSYSNKPESYKIFKEIKSPYSEKTAVLFGLDLEKTQECCSEPIGIFINNQGRLGSEYFILTGALQHLYLKNVRWQNDKTVLYKFVVADEIGEQITQKSLNVE